MEAVMRVLSAALFVSTVFGLALAPAFAEPGAARAKPKKDMNEMVCEKQEVLGSRLAVRRVCQTRADWAEQRRNERDLVQASQLNGRQKQCSTKGC
jgi:predicted secreted protein